MSFFDKARDRFPFPVVDELDLKVIAKDVPLKKSFDFISRIIWFVQFPTATILFTEFGVDAALTNGIQIKYLNQLILPHGIRNNAEFSKYSYDTRIDSDATAPKINYLSSRFSFTRFTRNMLGIKVDSRRQFFISVQDDLSGSSNTTISAMIEGWRF